jgi:predicted phage terminase large subunit-like protein
VVEPGREFVDNWHIQALCDHLEAVTAGDITRVLFNVPPGAMKSLLVNVFWPAWEWGPRNMPWVRYLSASYSEDLTVRDNRRCRAILADPRYQEMWGDRVQIDPRQDATGNFATMAKGWRIATSVGGVGTGERADRVIIDDPHSIKTADSEIIRNATLQWWREVIPTRVNDAQKSAFVVIMQRVHEEDVSGDIIAQGGWTHVMIPMRFDAQRAGRTKIGWSDPRTEDGDLFWPARFPDWTVQRDEQVLGKFAVASQFQQSPAPRGGGIVLREWWKLWPPEGQEDSWTTYVTDDRGREVAKPVNPECSYVLLSVDTAYTEKEENDWSACTVWGSFEMNGNPKIILLEAWRERLEMRALVMKILDTARRRKADGVLIEAKASGLSVMQEMRRLMRDGEFTIFSEVPRGDKVARLHAVVPQFSGGLVYAPNRGWADMVIEEIASFPRAKHDDLVDTASSALKKLRELGIVQHPAEVEAEKLERLFRAGNRPARLSIEQEYGL